MTLSSLFLRLFIFGRDGVARVVDTSRGGRVRGTPTAFPFRAGLTRRAPGALRLSGPPIIYSIVKSAGSRGCAHLEQYGNISPTSSAAAATFWTGALSRAILDWNRAGVTTEAVYLVRFYAWGLREERERCHRNGD
jgi:hypothetical protein